MSLALFSHNEKLTCLSIITEQKRFEKNVRIVSNLITCLRVSVAVVIVIATLLTTQKQPQQVAKDCIVTKH